MRSRSKRLAALLLVLGIVLAAGLVAVFRNEIFPEYSEAHRGVQVARSAGCFSCHGAEGGSGAVNPSLGKSADEFTSVPALLSERHSPLQLRQWIEAGISQEKRESEAHMQARERAALQMPAYGERLSSDEIAHLMAYIALLEHREAARSRPPQSPGEELARRYSCFTCHGELGQGGVDNPGSLKGYVPGFFGNDFLALTKGGDRQQVLEWIRDGASESFLNQGFAGIYPARYFSERQAIQMPAYRDRLNEEELEALTDYVLELHALGSLSAAQIYNLPKQGHVPSPGADEPEADDSPLAASDGNPGSDASTDDFALFYQVKPILKRCLRCHGPSEQKSEYRMEVRKNAIKGGEIAEFTGTPAIAPGDSQQSLMIRFVTAEEEDPYNEIYPMPPEGERLTPAQIELLRRWIDQGLKWPPGEDLLPPPEE